MPHFCLQSTKDLHNKHRTASNHFKNSKQTLNLLQNTLFQIRERTKSKHHIFYCRCGVVSWFDVLDVNLETQKDSNAMTIQRTKTPTNKSQSQCNEITMHARQNPVLRNQIRFLAYKETKVQTLYISMHTLFVNNGSVIQSNAMQCEHKPKIPTNTKHGVEHMFLEQPTS
jgi:hypothetical protein